MTEKTITCGAEAWKSFEVVGFLVTNRHRVVDIRCGWPAGHDGKHGGWLWLNSGRGAVQARVDW